MKHTEKKSKIKSIESKIKDTKKHPDAKEDLKLVKKIVKKSALK